MENNQIKAEEPRISHSALDGQCFINDVVNQTWHFFNEESLKIMSPEAEFKEFEPRLKYGSNIVCFT